MNDMTPAPISVERLREAISDIQEDVLRGTLFADVAHKKLERLKAVVAQQHNEIVDLRQRHHESLLAWEAETRRSSEQQERAEAAERAREEATGLLRDCDTVANVRGMLGVPDCIDNNGQPYQSAHLAAFLAASGGK